MKEEFFKNFLNIMSTNFFNFYIKSNECKHWYDNTTPNQYHIENDLWTHTLMVYNNINISGCDLIDKYVLLSAALLHDIGKLFSRTVDDAKQKVHFLNHSQKGTQLAIDITYKMFEKNYTLTEIELKYILENVAWLVNNHDKFYTYLDNPQIYSKLTNYNTIKLEYMHRLIMADATGRISTHSREPEKIDEIFKQIILDGSCDDMTNRYDCSIELACGLPGSGKDYISNRFFSDNILSYDKCRIEAFKESDEYLLNKELYDKNEKFLYSSAYHYCNDNYINLNEYLEPYLKDVIVNNKETSICNTFLHKKSRKSMLNIIKNIDKNIKVSCLFVISPTEMCINNDLNRSDKTVYKSVINNMAKYIDLPTLEENFDNVDYYVNLNGRKRSDDD